MDNKLETLVYITGSGRSGSTLLDMLLSTHPDIAALGEVHRFSMSLGRKSAPHRCTCGDVIDECEFWSAVIEKLKLENIDPYMLKTTWKSYEYIGDNHDGTNIIEHVPPQTLLKTRVNLFNIFLSLGLSKVIDVLSSRVANFQEGVKIAEDSWFLYEKTCEVNAKKILIDGSKTPGRLLALMAFNRHQVPIKVIYLCRDGRAVAHARMKRQGLSMRSAVKIWVIEHKKISIALRRFAGDIHYVKYEDLCVNTGDTLQEIFTHIGADGLCDNKSFRDSSHSLGGNPMRLRSSEREIILNEQWKDELSREELNCFESIGGGLNKKLGYGGR
jgi:hypothetical protein